MRRARAFCFYNGGNTHFLLYADIVTPARGGGRRRMSKITHRTLSHTCT